LGSSTANNTKTQAARALRARRLLLWLQGWREPLWIFLGFRFGLAIAAFFVGVFFPAVARGATAPYSLPPLNRWGERLLGIWSHWDGEWYLLIAQNGYRPADGTSAFFPFYPLLIKLLGWLLGGNYLLAGVLISTAATLAVMILLYELIGREFGRETGSKTVLYLAAFPTAFFLAAIYSESLFLALALGAFLAVRHWRNWVVAGLLVALASLTRSMGILLLIPLAWEWWKQRQPLQINLRLPFLKQPKGSTEGINISARLNLGQTPDLLRMLPILAAPLLAIAGWLLFNGVALGDPLNFLKIQNEYPWNRHTAWPWEAVWKGAQVFFAARGPDGFLPPAPREDPNLLDFPFFVFFAAMLIAALWQTWRGKLPVSYLLYFGIGLLFPLLSPTPKQPLLSFPRFGLVLFPAFVVLAQWGSRWRWLHYIYLYTALLLLGLLFGRFANWYWVA
jgi:hypothetical protein